MDNKVSNIINGEDIEFVHTVKEIVAEIGIEVEVDAESRKKEVEDAERRTKTLIKEGLKEMNDRRMKENNVVIYGVTEELTNEAIKED